MGRSRRWINEGRVKKRRSAARIKRGEKRRRRVGDKWNTNICIGRRLRPRNIFSSVASETSSIPLPPFSSRKPGWRGGGESLEFLSYRSFASRSAVVYIRRPAEHIVRGPSSWYCYCFRRRGGPLRYNVYKCSTKLFSKRQNGLTAPDQILRLLLLPSLTRRCHSCQPFLPPRAFFFLFLFRYSR